MTTIEFAWVIFFGFGGISAFAYYVANIAEGGVSQEAKRKFQNIVSNIKATPSFRHAFLTFTMVSDNYFGDKLFSKKAFFRSVLLSLLWITLLTLTCILLFPKFSSWFNSNGTNNLIYKYAILFLAVILVLDYLSITCTRFFIQATRFNSITLSLVILIVDFLLSILIFYLGFSIAKYLLVHPSWPDFIESIKTWINIEQLPVLLITLNDLTSDMLKENPDGSHQILGGLYTEVVYAFPEGIVFYSSLLTSFWLWIHTISYLMFKLAIITDTTKRSLLNITNLEQQPFKSFAMFMLMLYPIIGITIIVIYWLLFA